MTKNTIMARMAGVEAPSAFWAQQGVSIPSIQCEAPKPVFHESGYASGHAAEVLNVPGLLDQIKELASNPANESHVHFSQGPTYRTGWAWTRIHWADKESLVFLAHVYDDRQDVYSMSN